MERIFKIVVDDKFISDYQKEHLTNLIDDLLDNDSLLIILKIEEVSNA